jgi:PKD repeat protein
LCLKSIRKLYQWGKAPFAFILYIWASEKTFKTMKKIYTLCFALALGIIANAQTIFWLEEFSNGCSSLCTSYSGPNGAWTFTSTGPASACGGATTPNIWYISCAENGNAAGACGSGCGNNATLHVGNDPNSPSAGIFCPSGDCGAAYDAGGYCDILGTPPSTVTDITAASPAIDCSGRTTISLSFNYIERGQGMNDNATVMYFDGAAWSQLADMAKTPTTCGGGQGRWTSYTIALPASADNNPNVAIAFHWVNDDDGTGNDPSFAVDSVSLTVPGAGAPPVAGFTQGNSLACDSLCLAFTDGSTGATSWSWSFPGGIPATSTQASPLICYFTPGTYDVIQIVTNAFGTDTLVKPGLVVITETPIPDFSSTGQTLCVGDCIDYTDLSTGPVQSYSWVFQGGTPSISADQHPANVCYTTAGSFNTTLTVTNGACTNSNTHIGHINVTQPATPVITVNGDTLLSTPAIIYQWYEVTMGALPGISQYYIPAVGGNYYVCTTDAFGCQACSDTVHVEQVGVREFDVNQSFSVYPNPAYDQVAVRTSGALRECTMRLQDATGRIVMEERLIFVQSKAAISIDGIAKGSYVFQLLDDKMKIIFTAPLVRQ